MFNAYQNRDTSVTANHCKSVITASTENCSNLSALNKTHHIKSKTGAVLEMEGQACSVISPFQD